MKPRTALLTSTALIAFAANSWLCRAALRAGEIDPVSFTAVRIGSGAAVLSLLALAAARNAGALRAIEGNAKSAAALFVYALAFSFAYLALDSGLGALLLFGSVQLTMLGAALVAGHRPSLAEGCGSLAALAGLVLLAAPGRSAAPLLPALSMASAGVAWGIYSLRGRGATRPLAETAGNFVVAVPAAVVALAITLWLSAEPLRATPRGLALAAFSGAVTSGLGYAVWYTALPGLARLQAGLVQLAVPVLAAFGGAVLLGERIPGRLVVAGALVLGGIASALVVPARAKPVSP